MPQPTIKRASKYTLWVSNDVSLYELRSIWKGDNATVGAATPDTKATVVDTALELLLILTPNTF